MQTCGLVYFFQQTPRRGGRGIQWYSASVLEQTSMVKKREHYDHLEITHRCSEENLALSEHLAIGWDKSKIITTNRRYHQRLRLKAWHINSTHASLNRDDGGLLPDAYLHPVRQKSC